MRGKGREGDWRGGMAGGGPAKHPVAASPTQVASQAESQQKLSTAHTRSQQVWSSHPGVWLATWQSPLPGCPQASVAGMAVAPPDPRPRTAAKTAPEDVARRREMVAG